MTSHLASVVRCLLDCLADPCVFDGHLVSDSLLHGAVILRTVPPATLDEIYSALRLCESERWVTSVRGKLGALRWAITDAGIAARREM